MGSQPTVHLVYPTDRLKKSSPWSVGNHLLEALQGKFKVEVHDWAANFTITPTPNDILIGHPHPRRNTVYRRSFKEHWARRYVLCPFTTNPQQMYFVEPYVRDADAFFAICGPAWVDKLEESNYSHLKRNFIQLDMAITSDDWPPLGRTFSEPGNRRFAYIGSSLALKGTPFLEHLAARRPKNEIGWVGASSWVKSNAECIEYLDLNTQNGRDVLAQFDFVLSPGRSDANPTVLLEAMSSGLIPICTKESGYDDEDHFYLMEYGDIREGLRVLDYLQNLPTKELLIRQELNFSHVKSYAWVRFTGIVCEKIVGDLSSGNQNDSVSLPQRSRIVNVLCSWNSPYRRWRSLGIVKVLENRCYFRFAQLTKLMDA